jgi:hypothetical protein
MKLALRVCLETGLPAVLAVLSAVVILKCTGYFSVPWTYSGDGLHSALFIKTVLETGWGVDLPTLGAPFGTNHYDFPQPEAIHFAIVSLLGLVSKNFVTVQNLFFLASFATTVVLAHWVLRSLNVRYVVALAVALIFALLPFHFFRLEHLYLASYLVVPISVFVALTVFQQGSATSREKLVVAAASVVCGVAGGYWAFSSALLIASAGLLASAAHGSFVPLVRSAVLALIVTAAMVVNLIPNIAFVMRNGSNPAVAERAAFESELYGLRVTQMLLPMEGHRIKRLGAVTEHYGRFANVSPESKSSYLGVVGAVGFLILLACALVPERVLLGQLMNLARLNLVVLLFSMVGAFGTLFALMATPQFRALNRFSVIIAFLSLAGLALLIEHGLRRWRPSPAGRYAGPAVAATLIGIALFDQTSPHFVPPYEQLRREFQNDARFVQSIEAAVPRGAMVYQLPYVPYFETLPAHNEGFYGMLKGYLHSRELRWSYGSMRRREGDVWVETIAAMPMRPQLEAVAASGFRGVYIDRRGYADRGAAVERELKLVASGLPIESDDENLIFYPITPTGDRPVHLPVQMRMLKGFYAWEGDATGATSIWTERKATMALYSYEGRPVNAELAFGAATLIPRSVKIIVQNGSSVSMRLEPGAVNPIVLPLTLPPGMTQVHIESREPAVSPGAGDGRRLGVLLRHPTVRIVP